MKPIYCILSIALAGTLLSSLLPVTADATCVGGSCTPSAGAPSRGAPAGGGGGGGGHGGGGGGNYWGGVAAGAAAGIVTGIITQQMMQQQQGQEPTYQEPARSRRVQRRSGRGNGDSDSSIDDVGVGDKAAVVETSPIDPPLNQYAQVPSDNIDTGIRSDAGSGLTQLSTSAGPTQETTGSVGSSGSTTEPHVPGIPYEEPQDYLDWKGHVVEWLFDQGLEQGIEAIPIVGPVAVLVKSLASNGKSVKTGAQSASRKYEAENEMANERKAPAIESMERNAAQGMKPFGSDLNNPELFGKDW